VLRERRWRDLARGVVALVAIVAGALSVLVFARVGALHGDTYTLYVPVGSARGVIPGTDVWLAGQRVGLVKRIDFAPATVDTARRLLIEVEILQTYQEYIRRDSYAQVRSGGSLIGAPVVYITVGTSGEPILADRAYMTSVAQADAETITSEIAIATRDIPATIQNIRAINAQFKGLRDVMGTLAGDEGAVELKVVTDRAARLTRRATAGDGSVALLVRDERLLERAASALTRADSLMRVLDADKATFGRPRGDRRLERAVIDVRNEVSIVRTRLSEARGTAGRLRADSAVLQELSRFERELGRTIEDFKRDPGRYVAF
jgi:phospholipid/cholesterol/gamma-HCH transport system substrate-binding protein